MRRESPPPAPRRGMMLLEVTVSAVLIGAALVLVARLLGGLATARESTEHRQWAVREAGNTLERLTALPWDRLTAGGTAESLELAPSRRAAEALPDGRAAVSIDPVAEAPDALRLSVTIYWSTPSGPSARPVRLTAWVYDPQPGGER